MVGRAPSSIDLAGDDLDETAAGSVHSTSVFRVFLDAMCARGSLGVEGYTDQDMKQFPSWEDHLVQGVEQ